MDIQRQKEIIAAAEAAKKAGDIAGMKSVLQDGFREAAADGAMIQSDQIESMAAYVQVSVETALKEILATAREMGAKVVPVEFIEYVATLPATGARQLWATMEELDVPVDWGVVPDDLSELEGS